MKKRTFLPLLALAAALSAVSVHADSSGNPLAAFVQQLVLPTYAALSERTDALAGAAGAVLESPSPETVEAARSSWLAARVPWERSEAFLFGPVDQEGHDPYLDSWPVNVTDLRKVLDPATGPKTLNAATVDSLSEGLRGFHVVEYLLFADADGNPVDAAEAAGLFAADTRRGEYLVAASEALRDQAAALLADYDPAGGDFTGQIISAGNGSEVYLTRAAALSDIVNAMAGIADESAQEKLLAPAVEQDVTILESRFSGNTLGDVLDNIGGIDAASELVLRSVLEDADLKQRLFAAIALYRAKVLAIPPSFNVDPAATKSEVEEAAAAGAALLLLLEEEVVPAVRAL